MLTASGKYERPGSAERERRGDVGERRVDRDRPTPSDAGMRQHLRAVERPVGRIEEDRFERRCPSAPATTLTSNSVVDVTADTLHCGHPPVSGSGHGEPSVHPPPGPAGDAVGLRGNEAERDIGGHVGHGRRHGLDELGILPRM